ncbi:MAG: nucleoside triphosphate pyrophosphohydrolase [Coriobacteriaceae bacterium]
MTEKLVAEVQPTEHPAFNEFVATIEALRSPDGCPWDKEQTHKSISGNMVEEAYEAVDAIEADDVPHMREELGDVLLQVVLQSQIAADAGEFTIDDVCRDVNAKIVRRHPHVFGDVVAGDANEVLDVWDQIKMAEKESADAAADAPQGLLDGVPKSFPALKQAQKISRKAASAGFEWETVDDVWAKVDEEVAELKAAYAAAPKSANGKVDAAADRGCRGVELEMGDVLFSLVNVARKMGVRLRRPCAPPAASSASAGPSWKAPPLRWPPRGRPLHGEMEELWQLESA